MVTIVRAAPDSTVLKEVVCRKCGFTLSYVPLDTFKETHTDYGGGSDTYTYIKCPNCLNKVTVK